MNAIIKKKIIEIYFRLLKIKNKILIGKPVLVLMYHRVNNVCSKNLSHLTVSVENFEKQVIYFKNNFSILRFNESWKSLKKNGLIITFDDGYADNFLNALPILEKYQIPAIFFVSTLNINTKNEFWWDRLDYDYEHLEDLFYIPNNEELKSKKSITFKFLSTLLSDFSNEEREHWFCDFERLNKISFSDRNDYVSLTTEQILSISKNPLITIGMHSHNHYNLKNLSNTELNNELRLSVNIFYEVFGFKPELFALPFGSYNIEQLSVIKSHGIKHVFLANDYYSNLNQKKKGIISRIIITNISDETLVERLNRFV